MRATEVFDGFIHERWTILSSEFLRDRSTGQAWFSARCVCGTERVICFRGKFQSKSCGCLQREITSAMSFKHGGAHDRLNRVWRGMRERCSNENRAEYHNYGGRGIHVVSEWDSYEVFRDWSLTHGYASDLDIDRINNNGPYSPDNCRWVTRKQNLRNTRTNRHVLAFGETKTMAEWSEDQRCQVPRNVFEGRLRLNWKPEDALTCPRNSWNPARKQSGGA